MATSPPGRSGGDFASVGNISVMPGPDPESVTLREHIQALDAERDRRQTESASLRAEALKIKEEGDSKALTLAREIQQYKDEQANNLRSQIESERGSYVTQTQLIASIEKIETQIKPLHDYVATQQGRASGIAGSWAILLAIVAASGTIISILIGIIVLVLRI